MIPLKSVRSRKNSLLLGIKNLKTRKIKMFDLYNIFIAVGRPLKNT